jgi:hypothetical protein
MITQKHIINFFTKYFSWLLLISLLIYFLYLKPEPVVYSNEDKYLDSINSLKENIVKLDSLNKSLNYSYDSLNNVKQKIKIEYHEKFVFINSASASELDSIIRSNIK